MKAISIDNLEPGMILARNVTNSDMAVVLSEGTTLEESHINRLKNQDVINVYIKDEADLSPQVTSILLKDQSFAKDFEIVSKYANEVFSSVSNGQVPQEQTEQVTDHILPLADNSGSIDYLFALGHKNATIAMHSERVAILSGIIAKWMHFSWEDIRNVVTAAFLHDVGRMKLPDNIINRNPENLNENDYKIYQSHCEEGSAILKDSGFDEIIQVVALSHHENMDGSGYPNGFSGEAIHPYARIVTVANRYDAITSENKGDDKKTPFDAITLFAKDIYSTLDPVVCVPLLTRIKDSLIGSKVTLSDGRSGSVALFPNDFSALPIIALDDGTSLNLNKFPNLTVVQYSPA